MEVKLDNSQWRIYTIDELKADVPNALAMGPFGSNITTDNFVPFGIPVIRGNNLQDSKFSENEFVYVTEEKANSLKSANVFCEDIVFTHRGTLGQVAIIPSDSKFKRYVISQSQMKLTCNRNKVDPYFVYYYFISPEGQHQLLSYASTTGVPAIGQPLTSLKKIELTMPSLPTQKKISHILLVFDKKITYLVRFNNILEKIIQSIFKSWFIDFDGQKEFVDSKLGEIPKGWKAGKLKDIACNIKTQTNPQLLENNLNYVGLEHMTRGSIALTEWGNSKDIRSNKFQFNKYDILFGKLRPYFKKVAFATVDGICSTDILVINSKSINWYGYVLCIVSSDEFINYTDMASTGTRMPRTDWDTMSEYSIILPPEEIVRKFGEYVRNIVEMIKNNALELQILKIIRDSLLPKLMSGEIEV